ncbi:hypothetical protein NDU88_000713 [Pleurodeles waltl]|uniref:Uncharacterized protein n=1 Tax=Pleurodeles waltl TaxID=8319 RepID=A0AAV7LVH5_PLEWA|nr:hypothetical protein NDU88_000713 [Pleurodeles waltl]
MDSAIIALSRVGFLPVAQSNLFTALPVREGRRRGPWGKRSSSGSLQLPLLHPCISGGPGQVFSLCGAALSRLRLGCLAAPPAPLSFSAGTLQDGAYFRSSTQAPTRSRVEVRRQAQEDSSNLRPSGRAGGSGGMKESGPPSAPTPTRSGASLQDAPLIVLLLHSARPLGNACAVSDYSGLHGETTMPRPPAPSRPALRPDHRVTACGAARLLEAAKSSGQISVHTCTIRQSGSALQDIVRGFVVGCLNTACYTVKVFDNKRNLPLDSKSVALIP